MTRWLLGICTLALLATGVGILALGRGSATRFVIASSIIPSVRAAGPGDCAGVLRESAQRLGRAPSRTGSGPIAQVRAIAAEVERIRGIQFSKQISPEFVTQLQLDERIASGVTEGYSDEQADADGRVLAALGAIPPGNDMRELVKEALSGGVIGYYESDSKKIVVSTSDPKALLTPLARMTLAHELTHALTDQAFGLPGITDESDPGEEDASLAALALIEGDASLVMQLFLLTSLSSEDQSELLDDPAAVAAQEAETFPYLQNALEFPYLTGLGFVCNLYTSGGGWTEIDTAYDQLPATTAQILFADRYRAREAPVDPPDPGNPGEGWTEGAFYSVGAADLVWLFDAPGGDETEGLSRPEGRASEWAGGEARLWTRGADSAVGLALAQQEKTGSLCDSTTEWYRRSFPKDKVVFSEGGMLEADGRTQDAVVSCRGTQVRVGIAPDMATARALVR